MTGSRMSTCSPRRQSMGATRSRPRAAIAEERGADAPENKSKKSRYLVGDGWEAAGAGGWVRSTGAESTTPGAA